MAKAVCAPPLVHFIMDNGRSYQQAVTTVATFLARLEGSLGINSSDSGNERNEREVAEQPEPVPVLERVQARPRAKTM
jgi:hypothetical protein